MERREIVRNLSEKIRRNRDRPLLSLLDRLERAMGFEPTTPTLASGSSGVWEFGPSTFLYSGMRGYTRPDACRESVPSEIPGAGVNYSECRRL